MGVGVWEVGVRGECEGSATVCHTRYRLQAVNTL